MMHLLDAEDHTELQLHDSCEAHGMQLQPYQHQPLHESAYQIKSKAYMFRNLVLQLSNVTKREIHSLFGFESTMPISTKLRFEVDGVLLPATYSCSIVSYVGRANTRYTLRNIYWCTLPLPVDRDLQYRELSRLDAATLLMVLRFGGDNIDHHHQLVQHAQQQQLALYELAGAAQPSTDHLHASEVATSIVGTLGASVDCSPHSEEETDVSSAAFPAAEQLPSDNQAAAISGLLDIPSGDMSDTSQGRVTPDVGPDMHGNALGPIMLADTDCSSPPAKKPRLELPSAYQSAYSNGQEMVPAMSMSRVGKHAGHKCTAATNGGSCNPAATAFLANTESTAKRQVGGGKHLGTATRGAAGCGSTIGSGSLLGARGAAGSGRVAGLGAGGLLSSLTWLSSKAGSSASTK